MLNEVFWIFHPTPYAPSLLSAAHALIKAALLPPLNPWTPVRQKRCMLLNIRTALVFPLALSSMSLIFPTLWYRQKKKVNYEPLFICRLCIETVGFFFINRNKHEKSIRKWKKHCELSQLQNVKNSKQPQGKKGTAWRVYLQIHCTYASNITKPASSGFTKGKYTLDAEIIHSKTQPCIKIRFHAPFTSQCNLEAEQQQLKETNGGRKNRNTGRASRHISGVLLSVSGYTTAHMTDLR